MSLDVVDFGRTRESVGVLVLRCSTSNVPPLLLLPPLPPLAMVDSCGADSEDTRASLEVAPVAPPVSAPPERVKLWRSVAQFVPLDLLDHDWIRWVTVVATGGGGGAPPNPRFRSI
jgi:hypothetical protein